MDKKKKIFNFSISPEDFIKNNLCTSEIEMSLKSLSTYEEFCKYIPTAMKKNYESIDPKYLTKLPFNYKDKIAKVQAGINLNQEFYNKIVNYCGNGFYYQDYTEDEMNYFQSSEQPFLRGQFLKSLIIEWGDEGNEERNIYNVKILEELKKYYNYEDKSTMEKNIKVLVPGARFLRLPYELLKKGYKVEAIEKTYFYILVSNFLFNNTSKNEFQVCPRIHSFCSSFSEESVTKKHSIPNVNIKEELKNLKENDFKFVYGEFPWFYKDKEKNELFDSVITLFSIEDTINIIESVETIYNVLKKGGVWINIDSFDYWYSSNYEGYDLTWNELKQVIINYGFEIKNEETMFIPYGKIKGCSLPFKTGCVFFSAVKI